MAESTPEPLGLAGPLILVDDLDVAEAPRPDVIASEPAVAAHPEGSPERPTPIKGFSTIEQAIAAIRRGEMIVVVDDEDRENEGDFVMAADLATPEAINFMVTHGRGLLCLPMTGERLDELEIGAMIPGSEGHAETNFTVSIDVERPGNTGISAYARAECIRRAVDPTARPSEFRRPGHVFPLRAVPGGVLEREGHTEAAVDLARLAGLAPAGVICEIMNDDGTMARLPELIDVAAEHDLHLVTIADLIAYRKRHEQHVEATAEATIPTAYGRFRARTYLDRLTGEEHVAIIAGHPEGSDGVLVRLHSECLTGDLLGSRRCDCGPQLDDALRLIATEGEGVVVYLRGHEGRGIGLAEKLRAYELQDDGHDTVTANIELGHPADARDYTAGGQILRDLDIASVRLLTNNPVKEQALADFGIAVTQRIAHEVLPNPDNLRYLQTKRDKLGHDLRLGEVEGDAGA